MAADWIKMRGNLWDDPRIARLVDLTDSSEAAVVGACFWLWATADQHTEDGALPGLSLRQIDRKTGLIGFAEALCVIGWIADHVDGIRIINFEEHNGASAKRRSEDAKRKTDVRKVSDKTRTTCGSFTEKSGGVVELEEEKEKEKEEEKRNTGRERRASRLPADFSLPLDWSEFCQHERPDLDAERTFAKFRDYWTAKPGKAGTKVDWLATWRNWVREERGAPARSQPVESFAERDERKARERYEEFTGKRSQGGQAATVIDITPASLRVTA